MKKSLLLLVAAIGLSTTAKAQKVVAPDFNKESANLLEAPASASVEAPVDMTQLATPSINGPKRSVENGVWFKRPSGTFLYTGSSWRYMYVPPFTELTWTNMYTADPSAAVWAYGATSIVGNFDAQYVVDNNYVNSYNKNVGSGAYYAPWIYVEGVDTFSVVHSQAPTAQALVIAPDTITEFFDIPNSVQYSGFTNFKYGTNAPASAARGEGTDTYVVDSYEEFYRAPAQPLYLDGIVLYARMPDGVTEPVTATSEGVTCYVIQATENGHLGNEAYFTDTVAIIPINPTLADIADYQDGYLTRIQGYCMEEDDFGDMVQKITVLEKDFLLVFEGFNNEGVNFVVNMSRVPSEEMYNNGGAFPTVYTQYWTSDGAVKGSYYQYDATSGTQYNMQIRLNGMFDVCSLGSYSTEFTAPDAGGAVVDGDGYVGVYIQTVFPYQSDESPMPSYEIENLPDWLSVSSYNDTYYVSNYGWTTVINLTAQALPAGVEGRKATLRFISEKGAKSEEFTVIQGDEEAAGINGVKVDEEVTGIKRGTFNLAGQRVGKDYKGIVIENGKKVIRK